MFQLVVLFIFFLICCLYYQYYHHYRITISTSTLTAIEKDRIITLSLSSVYKTKRKLLYVTKAVLFHICPLYYPFLLLSTTTTAITTVSAGHTFFTFNYNNNKNHKYKYTSTETSTSSKSSRIDTSTGRLTTSSSSFLFIAKNTNNRQQQHETRTSYSSIAPVTTKSNTCIVPTKTKSCFTLFSNNNNAMTDSYQQQFNQYTNNDNNNINNNNNNKNKYNNDDTINVDTKKNSISTIILDPLIVCGPSGVGKGTIIEHYMRQVQEQKQKQKQQQQQQQNWNQNNNNLPEFKFAISHTTRLPRPNELNGTHYYFISISEMERLIFDKEDDTSNNDYFLEYAKVHDNYYGTSYQTLFDAQQNQKSQNQNQQYYHYQQRTRALLDIDVQGVQRIKEIVQLQQEQIQNQNQNQQQPKYILQPKYIFISPPSIDILYERLVKRNTESIEIIQKRITNAQKEILYGTTSGNFDTIIINNNLQQCITDFTSAVQQLYNK